MVAILKALVKGTASPVQPKLLWIINISLGLFTKILSEDECIEKFLLAVYIAQRVTIGAMVSPIGINAPYLAVSYNPQTLLYGEYRDFGPPH